MKSRNKLIIRWVFYLLGLLILALGIMLNTKANLGVSPIISVPYSISHIIGFNFANMTMIVYFIFVLIEMIMHTVWYLTDRKEAIKYAIEHGEPGDIIVLAGKGHEDYQEIKGVKYPMDERVLIKEVLEELKGNSFNIFYFFNRICRFVSQTYNIPCYLPVSCSKRNIN